MSGAATMTPPTQPPAVTALRGAALTFVGDPFALPGAEALRHESDALIVIRDGRIEAFGAAPTLLPTLPPGTPITRYANALILPGFVDAHVHFAQLPVIGAFGRSLLDWLSHYAYVVEERTADRYSPRPPPRPTSTNARGRASPQRSSTAPRTQPPPKRSLPPPSGATGG
jgi:hypothetical protein